MTKNSKKQKAERARDETKINNDASPAAEWPDFEARAREIFGDRILPNVVFEDRGRY